jgi:outer membrane protein OmpA-like peptidoglycan-associated protein
MAVDWLADVRIYDADADESVVNKIVNYCGIALQSRDGQLVAMADPKECETVRENFLKKKLGLTQSDAVLDEAIQSVREVMKADRTKNRVTVYYLLTKHFGSLNLFGGVAGAAAGAAGLAAAAAGAFSGDDKDGAKDDGASVAPLAAAAGIAGAGVAAVTGAAASAGAAVSSAASGAADLASDAASSVADTVTGVAGSVRDTVAAPLAAVGSGYDDDNSGGGFGWLKWLLLAALLAALLFFLLKSCSGQEATPVADTATTEATTTEEAPEAAATAETAVAAPVGAGVAAGERNGKPMLTVYFDTGKSDVTADLAAAAAKVKAYAADNAGAKLGVSGFNDPTGNAAANAELSKKRAQAVGKALEAAGIPAASIEMVKPAESTDTKVDNTAARRVEVVVQ